MFRSIKKVLLAVLLVAPAVALAQQTGTVAGTVVDAATGESLPGANVLIEETTLGAAADIDGNFRIIGVPVGTHDIAASFVGYESVTLTGVDVSASFTRTVEFELSTGAELEEVQVVYERPLIERSAVGAPRTVSGDDIQNLPVRGAQNVASIQSGVVEGQAGGLNVRGGRSEEVAYYVDGVRIRGVGTSNIVANQGAIAEQEMLIGTIPAKYGDAQSGVISLTTKTGRSQFFGSLEGYTSQVLDGFGWSTAALSVGGPIVPGTVGFFLSGEGNWRDDNTPWFDHFQLGDDAFNMVNNRPQAMHFENAETGEEMFIPVPMEVFDDQPLRDEEGSGALISEEDILAAMNERNLIPEGFGPSHQNLARTPETLLEGDGFSEARGKDDPHTSYTFNGNLNFDILPTLSLRLGGAVRSATDRNFSFFRSAYNRNFTESTDDYFNLYGTLRQRISDNAFYQITGDFQDRQFKTYPEAFGPDITQLLNYGDVDAARWDVFRRYLEPSIDQDEEGNFVYRRANPQDGTQFTGQVNPAGWALPGQGLNIAYQQGRQQRFGVNANATVQLGAHQIEFGGEYQQRTDRFWSITSASARRLARFAEDDFIEGGANQAVDSYDDFTHSFMLERLGTYYGYDYLGLNEVNGENIEAFFQTDENGESLNPNVAPWKPFYYAGYVSDRIEFRDLIVDVGFRLDAYNANTKMLWDLWAVRPIFRASDVRAEGGTNVPGNVQDDWGVFYDGGNTDAAVVGYRDLDGNFYNANGEEVRAQVIRGLGGLHARNTDIPDTDVLADTETQFEFQPRLGVSFPVTDQALFFANYMVFSQRPTEQAFTPFWDYVSQPGGRKQNNGLGLERTTQYEVGFRQRLGERAALTISGFYRSQQGKIALRNLDLAVVGFGTFLNRDFTTTKGAEIGFQLRRTRNLAIDANYTLSFAQGSGSDANTAGIIAWRGNTFPNFIAPADFDQRHTANLSVDYRYGAGEGPVVSGARPFQNLGVNVIGRFGSGQRYTPLLNCGENTIADSFACDTRGNINSATLPSTFSVDLKLDRRFDLGFGESSLQLYLWVQNLLDTQNVLNIYRETGQADNQGFFNGSVGQSRLSERAFPESTLFQYDAYQSGPVPQNTNQTANGSRFYSPPRQIRLGVLFNF